MTLPLDTPKNGGNNETIDNNEEKNYEEEVEKETDNENLNMIRKLRKLR